MYVPDIMYDSQQIQFNLLQPSPDSITYVNERCYFREVDGLRTFFVHGIPLATYSTWDHCVEKLLIVLLVNNSIVTQTEAASAFIHSTSSIRRWQHDYALLGSNGLIRKRHSYPFLKMDDIKDQIVEQLVRQGFKNSQIANRIGVSESTVRSTVRRLGLQPSPPEPLLLPFQPESDSPDLPPEPPRSPDSSLSTSPSPGETTARPDSSEVPSLPVSTHELPPLPDEVASPLPCLMTLEPPSDGTLLPISPEFPVPSLVTSEPVPESSLSETPSGPLATEPLPPSMDLDPAHRHVDRQLARAGKLTEASPLFGNADYVPNAGALLAIPLVVKSGALGVFRKLFGSLKPGFYGLSSILLTFLFMALLRIKNPESLKEYLPDEFGRLLGLDRAPEVKALRGKLAELGEQHKGEELMIELGKTRLESLPDVLGFFYLDGHVREYSGKGKLAKTHVAQKGRATKGTTDTWVHDTRGDPVFVVTSELNAGLTQVIKQVVLDIRKMVGDRRFTLVFDRGGWSRELFAWLYEHGVDVLTYRKGKGPSGGLRELSARARKRFSAPSEDLIELEGEGKFTRFFGKIEHKKVTYYYQEQSVRMGNLMVKLPDEEPREFWMRQITRLCDDGHQLQVMTTRMDIEAPVLLYRMFNRWRQENFFKYMLAEYALDALADYKLEAVDAKLDRPNPERKALSRELTQAKAEVAKLAAEYGQYALDHPIPGKPTIRDFRDAHQELGEKLEAARVRVADLKARHDALPERVSAGQLERVSPHRKLITDAIKMCVYQIETDLVRMIYDDYARADDEGRTLIASAFRLPARIEVDDHELRIMMAPMSSPHRTRVLQSLLTQLNAEAACYPGTTLLMRYSISNRA